VHRSRAEPSLSLDRVDDDGRRVTEHERPPMRRVDVATAVDVET
jgi:hypothetical protein